MNNIRTEYVYPPIPTNRFDWAAWRDGNEEFGPIGRGATEQEAVTALLEQEHEL